MNQENDGPMTIFDLQDIQSKRMREDDLYRALVEADEDLYSLDTTELTCGDEVDQLIEQATARIRKAKRLVEAEYASEVLNDAELEDRHRSAKDDRRAMSERPQEQSQNE